MTRTPAMFAVWRQQEPSPNLRRRLRADDLRGYSWRQNWNRTGQPVTTLYAISCEHCGSLVCGPSRGEAVSNMSRHQVEHHG